MRIQGGPWRLGLMAAAVGLMSAMGTVRALADTYVLKSVYFTQNDNFVAGDDFGNYTISISNDFLSDPNASPCGGYTTCFLTRYVNGATVYTTTPPPLWVDPNPKIGDATTCAIPSAFVVLNEFCSNGHLLFSAYYDPPSGGHEVRGVFDGFDPVLNLVSLGTIDGGFMTANGNAYFIDGFYNTLDVAIDTDTIPTPEPGSLGLLGTGILAGIGGMRRRLRRLHG